MDNSKNYDVLNPDSDSEKGQMFLNGKTTFRNLEFINSRNFVQNLKDHINLLLPSEILPFLNATEIDNYLSSELRRKSKLCFDFLKGKYLYKETGEKVVMNDDFISFALQTNCTRQKMLLNLKNEKFSHKELDFFLSKIQKLVENELLLIS